MARKYSVYECCTDRPIAIHRTAGECAEVLGILKQSFYHQICRIREGHPPQKYEIFEDEEDEEDEMDPH